jgi:iron-sulfur cluster assembly protein
MNEGEEMITISDVAADKIKEILKAEGCPDHALRVHASEGSCCGPSFEILIDEKSGDGDTIVEKNGARLFIDASTAKALEGAELSFASDERGDGFVLGFPNGMPEGGSCGCGEETSKPRGGCGTGTGGCGCS